MTDTDLGSLKLIVIDKDSGDCGQQEMRDIFLRIFLEHNIQYRLDLSWKFSDKFELYGTFYETNKKHKGTRKGTNGMEFDNYASRMLTIEEAEKGSSRRFAKNQKQTCFQNTKGNMVMITIEKYEFGQLNNKRYILPDGISSLP